MATLTRRVNPDEDLLPSWRWTRFGCHRRGRFGRDRRCRLLRLDLVIHLAVVVLDQHRDLRALPLRVLRIALEAVTLDRLADALAARDLEVHVVLLAEGVCDQLLE